MCTLQVSMVFLVHLFPAPIIGQVDLNRHEIQFVADHLTDKKCDELINALHEKSYLLRPSQHTTSKPSLNMDVPCIVRITKWVKGPGRDLTYDYLALRLKEIGLAEVSDRLAQAVMRETADELHMFFLDNPFKDMIPTKSIMLDKPEITTKLLPAVQAEDKYDKMFITVLILAVLVLLFCLPVTLCLVCPRASHLVCLRACPSCCSLCFDSMVDGCHKVWYGSKKNADKYLFVTPQHRSGGMLV